MLNVLIPNHYPAKLNQYLLVLIMLSASNISCYISNAIKTSFTVEAITMNPDQTALCNI